MQPYRDTQHAYETIREYFSREDALLARMSDATCAYRMNDDPEADACAVGCLIPNDMYDPMWEGRGIESILEENDNAFGVLFENVDLDFLGEAQKLHDNEARDASDFINRLDDAAHDFNLIIPQEAA